MIAIYTCVAELFQTVALSGGNENRGELRIHESLDELRTDLAHYIAELSEASVKERGVFAIALSGGSLKASSCTQKM
ncbi:Glucosamine/galactosamine-6-phosphate isomerase [Sesbania bispinosa]|nr:Glucosamine/galactosamine-6-phosphate isomerase [Sesbania bispinosa]